MLNAGMKNVPLLDAWQFSSFKTSFFKHAGFVQVSPVGYHAQIGDIVVWLPERGNPSPDNPTGAYHIHGHIQVYTGKPDHPWVSDFKQNLAGAGFVPGLPGPGWNNKRAVYEIYRYFPENTD